jgi:hypothetical protein
MLDRRGSKLENAHLSLGISERLSEKGKSGVFAFRRTISKLSVLQEVSGQAKA